MTILGRGSIVLLGEGEGGIGELGVGDVAVRELCIYKSVLACHKFVGNEESGGEGRIERACMCWYAYNICGKALWVEGNVSDPEFFVISRSSMVRLEDGGSGARVTGFAPVVIGTASGGGDG
jgi:hypothetical protein